MSPLKLIIKEIAHRKVNALLWLLAVTVAVSGSLVFHTAFSGSLQRTKRIQRDMGQNLRIVSKETDLADFWDQGFSQKTFPETWVRKFTEIDETINYSHLSPVLKWKVRWRGSPAMIYGMAPREVAPPGREKPLMIVPIEQGTVQLGRTLANLHGVKTGETVTVEGVAYKVARVLSEKGNEAEIRIYMHLADAQVALDCKGLINEIQALDCYCADKTQDTLALLRQQLAPILPEAQVFRMQDVAEAREKQRREMERAMETLLPVVVIACGLIVATLALHNTRARKEEIGVLRALGKGGDSVAALLMGKALALGAAGAITGFALGSTFLTTPAADALGIPPKLIGWNLENLKWSMLLAPTFSVLASFIPVMLAVTQDPADALRHDS